MSTSKIYYAKPSITNLEISYVKDAITNGWGEHCYDYIYQFENSFKNYVGNKFAVATSSATGALHLGLAALGIGPGDEVILADTNWIASAAPIMHLGATPVFVDILPDSWCLDPAKVKQAITSRTKAIIAVHLYGNLCDMDALEAVASKHKLHLVEDAAEAFGSKWGKVCAGCRGIFGVFSFHGTKTLTTGEGGILVTNNESLNTKVQTLNNHGRLPGEKKQFWPSILGYKYKLSNLQAALGCAQVERSEQLIARRREIFYQYQQLLSAIPKLIMNPEPQGTINGFWMPTIIFPKEYTGITQRLAQFFTNDNIDARMFFHPLSSLPFMDHFRLYPNKNSYSYAERGINLPCYHDLNFEQIKRVVDLIYKAISIFEAS